MRQGCQRKRDLSTAKGRIPRSALRRELKRQIDRLEHSEAEAARLRQEVKELRERLQESRGQLELAQEQGLQQSWSQEAGVGDAFRERPLPGHQFCTRVIALSIELAKRVGFRAADILKQVFEAVGIEQWTLRLSVLSLPETFSQEDRVWMADHSVQIGPERVSWGFG